jgi:hypothetical protein
VVGSGKETEMFQENGQSHSGCDHAYGYCAEEFDGKFRSQAQKDAEGVAGFAAGEAAGNDYGGPKDAHLWAVSKHYRFEFERAVDEVVQAEAEAAYAAKQAAERAAEFARDEAYYQQAKRSYDNDYYYDQP